MIWKNQRNGLSFQDASVLRGEHRQPLTEIDGRSRASKVGLPSDSNIGLLEKQRTFEAMDYQARKVQEDKNTSFIDFPRGLFKDNNSILRQTLATTENI